MDLHIALIALAPALGVAATAAGARTAHAWLDAAPEPLGWPATFAGALAGLLVAGLAVWGAEGWRLGLAFALGFAFLYAGVVDLRSKLLPDWPSAAAALAGLGLGYVGAGWGGLAFAAIGALCAGAAFQAVALFFRWRMGREALGLGDVKLAAAGGALLGPVDVWLTVAAAAGATAVLAMALAALRGTPLTRQSEAPFGPGLLAAIWISWVLHNAPLGAAFIAGPPM